MLCCSNCQRNLPLQKTGKHNGNFQPRLVEFNKITTKHKKQNNFKRCEQRKTAPNIYISKSVSLSQNSLNSKQKKIYSKQNLKFKKKQSFNLIKRQKKYQKKIQSEVEDKGKLKSKKLKQRNTHTTINTTSNTCNVSSLINLNSKKSKLKKQKQQSITNNLELKPQKNIKAKITKIMKVLPLQKIKNANLKKTKNNKSDIWKSTNITCFHSRNNSTNKIKQIQLNKKVNLKHKEVDFDCHVNKSQVKKKSKKQKMFIQTRQNSFILGNLRQQLKINKIKTKQADSINDNKTDLISLKKIKQRNPLFSFNRNSQQNDDYFQNGKDKTYKNMFQTSIEQFLPIQSFTVECQENLQKRLISNGIMIESLDQLKQKEFTLSLVDQQSLILPNRSNQSSVSSGIMRNEIQKQQNNIFPVLSQQEKIARIQLIDLISILSQGLLLKRQTFHLAVLYFDTFYQYLKIKASMMPIIFTCLMISIKMEERQCQQDILNILVEFQPSLKKQELVQIQVQILIEIRPNLKKTTLVFWIDYFSKKWDEFLVKSKATNKQQLNSFLFRNPQAKSYECYRKACQIIDTIIMDQNYLTFSKNELGLTAIFLVLEQNMNIKQYVQSITHQEKQNDQCQSIKGQIPTLARITQLNTLVQLTSNLTQEMPTKILLSVQGKQRRAKNIVNNISIINKISKNLQNEPIKAAHDSKLQDNETKLNQNLISNKDYSDQKNISFQKDQRKIFLQLLQKFIFQCGNLKIQELQQVMDFLKQYYCFQHEIQIDFKIYQESKNYQDFLRHHTHSPQVKMLFLKNITNQKLKIERDY